MVFTATKEGFITDAQPQLTTDCETVWLQIMVRNKKDFYLYSFYMPHRSINDVNRLDNSLKHIILAGDIDWEKTSVKKCAKKKKEKKKEEKIASVSICLPP